MAAAPQEYVHGHHDSVLRSHRWRTPQNSAAYLLPRLDPAARLLDVGCGPGTITVGLAALVPDGEVTGIDAAADVLETARAEAAAAGRPNVRFAPGDVYHLDYPDGAFDVVHAHQVLQHLADPVAALREMRRVTRPGGLVAARDGDYGGMLWHPADPDLVQWLALYRATARAAGGEPDAGRRLLSWARAAGFEQVEASASAWCYATPEDRAWWGSTWSERVTRSSLADLAVAHGLATRPDLERLARAWQRFATAPDAWFMVPSGEILSTVPAPPPNS